MGKFKYIENHRGLFSPALLLLLAVSSASGLWRCHRHHLRKQFFPKGDEPTEVLRRPDLGEAGPARSSSNFYKGFFYFFCCKKKMY
jgi:hypothetical protein